MFSSEAQRCVGSVSLEEVNNVYVPPPSENWDAVKYIILLYKIDLPEIIDCTRLDLIDAFKKHDWKQLN